MNIWNLVRINSITDLYLDTWIARWPAVIQFRHVANYVRLIHWLQNSWDLLIRSGFYVYLTHTNTHTQTHTLIYTQTNTRTSIKPYLWTYAGTHILISFSVFLNEYTNITLLFCLPAPLSVSLSLCLSIYIYIYISSCHAINTEIPDPLSPPLFIVHHFRQVFRVTTCIYTELLYVGLSWLSCLCSAMWRGPQEYITYDLVPTSPAMSCMSGSSNGCKCYTSVVLG